MITTQPGEKSQRFVAVGELRGCIERELRNPAAAAAEYQTAADRARRLKNDDEYNEEDWSYVIAANYYMKALATAEQGKFGDAANDMQYVARESKPPLQALARYRAGQYLLKLGQRDAAKDEFRRAGWNSFGNKGEYKHLVPAWLVEEARAEYEKLLAK